MIILDATNKSLVAEISSTTTSATRIATVVISYWSINSSNVWTPHSVETTILGNAAQPIVLPAPSAGETNVVENLWVHVAQSVTVNAVSIRHDTGTGVADKRILARVTGNLPADTVLTLRRDGSFDRSMAITVPSGPTGWTQNTH